MASSSQGVSLAAVALHKYKLWAKDRLADWHREYGTGSTDVFLTSTSVSLSRLQTAMEGRMNHVKGEWRNSKLRDRLQQWKAGMVVATYRAMGVQYPKAPAPAPAPILDDNPSALQQDQQLHAPEQLTAQQREAMFGKDGWLRYGILAGIANLSHVFMHSANTVQVEGGEIMRSALARPQGQALITVCNHVAAMDDPLVMSAIIPTEFYQQPSALRWTLCATDRCFKYAALSPFFTAAKVLPVQRGAGLQQPGMLAAEERLAKGDWVHIFPEGTRSRDPSHMGPVRKGVGRLIASAVCQGAPAPLVVPFVHSGMEKIMPVGSRVPRTGQQVHVVVGEPIPLQDLLSAAKTESWSSDHLYTAIAHRVEQRLHRMHADMHGLPAGVEVDSSLLTSGAVRRRLMGRMLRDSQAAWDTAAFNMWHRMWTWRLAAAQASQAVSHVQ